MPTLHQQRPDLRNASGMRHNAAMSKVKSPRQKKSNSLLKDRRNTYGESPASSRKNIRKGKQRTQQALRRAVCEELRSVRGTSEVVDAEMAQDRSKTRSIDYSRALFKKVPDQPLAVVRERKLQRRARQQQGEPPQPAGISEVLRSEQQLLRNLRAQPRQVNRLR
jgi:hypothetical protein